MTPGFTLALSLAAALVLGAGLTGWLVPGAPQVATLSVVRHGGAARSDDALLVRPGAGLAADVEALSADLAVPPPPRVVVATVVRRPAGLAPAPVVHDVAPIFRGRASAIVRLPNGRLAVLLAAGPDARSRVLHVGELFDDRWRLAGLTMNEATLANGATVERVPLFGEAVGAPGGEPQ